MATSFTLAQDRKTRELVAQARKIRELDLIGRSPADEAAREARAHDARMESARAEERRVNAFADYCAAMRADVAKALKAGLVALALLAVCHGAASAHGAASSSEHHAARSSGAVDKGGSAKACDIFTCGKADTPSRNQRLR